MTAFAIVVSAIALVLTCLATHAMRLFALRRNMIDIPNARSSHSVPVPRGGGLAIVVCFFGGMIALCSAGELGWKEGAGLLISGFLVASVGFLDDRKSLSARLRIIVQLSAAVILVLAIGGMLQDDLARWALHGQVASIGVALLALVWTTNLFNFMDGIDGIAGSEAIFIAGALAVLNHVTGGDGGVSAVLVCLAASTLGFLIWNWPPAKIFMGDVGSGFLGFMLAGLGILVHRAGHVPFEVVGILGGVFFADATVTLVRRGLRRERVSEPHRTHAYQHLARRWGSHRSVTLATWAVNLFWLLPWAWLASVRSDLVGVSFAAALIPLGVAVFLLGAGRNED
jgi:Fuc2NAc and GlcNAc transferase